VGFHISERFACSSLNLVSGLCKSNVGCRCSLSGADHVNTNSRSHMNNSSLRHPKRPWVERFIEIYFDRILQTLPAKLIQTSNPAHVLRIGSQWPVKYSCVNRTVETLRAYRTGSLCKTLFAFVCKSSSMHRMHVVGRMGLPWRSISLPRSLFLSGYIGEERNDWGDLGIEGRVM